MNELEVLIEQLDELLAVGIDDGEDAIEVATCAGLAARLGATPAQMEGANEWKDLGGGDLMEDLWPDVDFESLIEAIDAVSDGGAEDNEVEEAVFDFDDLVAAAAWLGHRDALLPHVARVSAIIRMIPDPFAPVAEFARDALKNPSVAGDLALHDHLMALTTADQYA